MDYKAQERYDKENAIRLNIKLNKKTDKDILEYLEGRNKNGTIKEAIRAYMKEGD